MKLFYWFLTEPTPPTTTRIRNRTDTSSVPARTSLRDNHPYPLVLPVHEAKPNLTGLLSWLPNMIGLQPSRSSLRHSRRHRQHRTQTLIPTCGLAYSRANPPVSTRVLIREYIRSSHPNNIPSSHRTPAPSARCAFKILGSVSSRSISLLLAGAIQSWMSPGILHSPPCFDITGP